MRVPAFAVIFALSACSPAAPPAVTPEPAPAAPPVEAPAPTPAPPPGSYGAADLEDATVKAAQAVAVDEIYKRDPQRAIVEKVEAEQQVVAGMNYHFVITMSGGARYGVTVFRNLDGEMTVSEFAKLS